MTLALYGKSRQRQGLLAGFGALAVVLAMAAGLLAWSSYASASGPGVPGTGLQNALNSGDGVEWGESFGFNNNDCGPYQTGYVWHFVIPPNEFVSFTGHFKEAGAVPATITDAGQGNPNSHAWLMTPTQDTLESLDVITDPAGSTFQLSHYCDSGVHEDPERTIRVIKVVEGQGAPNESFAGTITVGDGNWNLAHGQYEDFTTTSTDPQAVTETEDLSALGPTWSFGGYAELPGLQTSCDAASFSGSQAPGFTTSGGSDSITVCVLNQYEVPEEPGLTKVAVGWDAGVATWTVTIDNTNATTGGTTIARTVTVQDHDATLIAASPDACGSLPNNTGTFECQVGANSTVELTVTKPAPAQCEEGSISNSAILHLDGSQVDSAGPVNVTIPADSAECALPELEKVTVGWDAGVATWTVTIDNTNATTGGMTIARTVSVQDDDATLIAASPDACGSLPNNTSTFECHVAANSTVALTVTMPAAERCEERTIPNSATLHVDGDQVSSAGPAVVTVPADESRCGTPHISKSAVGWADGVATWEITVDNTNAGTGGTTIEQSVVIVDGGATLTNAIPDVCGTLPDSDGEFNCTIPANTELTLTVTKPAPQELCTGYLLPNQATLWIDEQEIASTGSPTVTVAPEFGPAHPECAQEIERTIRIIKVVEGTGAPNESFEGTVNAGAGTWVLGDGELVDIATTNEGTVMVVETSVLEGEWSFGGYAQLPGIATAADCREAAFSGSQAGGIEAPAGTESATVCVLNVYEPAEEIPTATETPDETETAVAEPTQPHEGEAPAPPSAGSGFLPDSGTNTATVLFALLSIIAFTIGAGSLSLARRER